MKGLELARQFYEQCGKPMLSEEFKHLTAYLAVGLAGSGSECLGFDDELSQDHDFEPGFCIFLPGEDVVDRREAFRLERAYARLPREFMGYTRSLMGPVGGSRHGVIRTADFYKEKAGIDVTAGGQGASCISMNDWLHIPSYALREATGGEVFEDPYGQFSEVRTELLDMPEDARRKRLAGHILLMAQAGQYNFPRMIRHGEREAAQMAVFEFVKSALETVFLLNHEYMPYYKWSFRAMRSLLVFGDIGDDLYCLMSTGNDAPAAQDKYELIERICGRVIGALREQELTKADCADLEKHAYSVNDGIRDGQVRNLHILYAV